jgi:hypothetical protein
MQSRFDAKRAGLARRYAIKMAGLVNERGHSDWIANYQLGPLSITSLPVKPSHCIV